MDEDLLRQDIPSLWVGIICQALGVDGAGLRLEIIDTGDRVEAMASGSTTAIEVIVSSSSRIYVTTLNKITNACVSTTLWEDGGITTSHLPWNDAMRGLTNRVDQIENIGSEAMHARADMRLKASIAMKSAQAAPSFVL